VCEINYNYTSLEFTDHGERSFTDRSRMTKEELNDIVMNSKTVLLGVEKNRRHELLYSPVDNDYYVIIYDYMVGQIVTFLYDDFHSNIAWVVSQEAMMEARRLTMNEYDSDAVTAKQPPSQKPSVLRFKLRSCIGDSCKWISYPTVQLKEGITKKEVELIMFEEDIVRQVITIIDNKTEDILDDENIENTDILFTFGKQYIITMGLWEYLTILD